MIVSKENVILLHGMGRTSRSMSKIASSLENEGYNVVNVSYPSTKKTIPALLQEVVKPEIAKLKIVSNSKIHFVTHSLGGILVRAILQTEDLPNGSRIVMLCPPNHGSEIVDKYKNKWWFKRLNGPAGQVLGTDKQSLPNQLKSIKYDVGIITGTKSYEPWFSRLMMGGDDGKVSTNSAKLDEMKDFLLVPLGHTFIMQNSVVINQITYFLREAVFK